MEEFENDDINNIIQNLRQPLDTFCAEVPANMGRTEVLANVKAGAAHVLAILVTLYIDERTEKRASLIISVLFVKKMKLARQLVCHCVDVQRFFDTRKHNLCYSKGL